MSAAAAERPPEPPVTALLVLEGWLRSRAEQGLSVEEVGQAVRALRRIVAEHELVVNALDACRTTALWPMRKYLEAHRAPADLRAERHRLLGLLSDLSRGTAELDAETMRVALEVGADLGIVGKPRRPALRVVGQPSSSEEGGAAELRDDEHDGLGEGGHR